MQGGKEEFALLQNFARGMRERKLRIVGIFMNFGEFHFLRAKFLKRQ